MIVILIMGIIVTALVECVKVTRIMTAESEDNRYLKVASIKLRTRDIERKMLIIIASIALITAVIIAFRPKVPTEDEEKDARFFMLVNQQWMKDIIDKALIENGDDELIQNEYDYSEAKKLIKQYHLDESEKVEEHLDIYSVAYGNYRYAYQERRKMSTKVMNLIIVVLI